MSKNTFRSLSTCRRIAASVGMSAALIGVAAPAIAAAEAGSEESVVSDVTTSEPDDVDGTAAPDASETLDQDSPDAATVTVNSDAVTSSDPTPNAATDSISDVPPAPDAPVTEAPTAVADSAPTSEPTSADADSAASPTVAPELVTPSPTPTPTVDTDEVPYGRHAVRDSAQHEAEAEADGVDSEVPEQAPADDDGDVAQPADAVPDDLVLDRVEWLSGQEEESLAQISSKDAEIGEAQPASVFGVDGLPSALEAGLVISATGASAAAMRRATTETAQTSAAAYTTAAAGDDPDNRFWDTSDSDWGMGWSEWADQVDATPPSGASYSVGDDGAVTIHNNSDVDVAVISPFAGAYSDQGLTVIRPGQSYTIAETADSSGISAYWVQTERQDGKPVVIAQVMSVAGQVSVAPLANEGVPDQSEFLPMLGTTPVDTTGIDPGDRFFDHGDYAGLAGTGTSIEFGYADPEAAGVSYSVVDDGHVAIHNDGTADIAVTRATAGGQLLDFDILAPGESQTYATVPGNYSVVTVQAERDSDGKPVMLGGITTSMVDGSFISTAPTQGYPVIPVRSVPLPENHAPVGEVVAQSKPAAQRERVYVVNGFDFDGDTLSYSIHTAPARGTLVDNGDGSFTYTPTDPGDLHEGWVDDSFFIEISDGKGGTGLAYADVFYGFPGGHTNIVPEVTTTGGQSGEGHGTWTMTVTDADGDRISGVGVSTAPTYGTVEVTPVWADPDPDTGLYPSNPDHYVVTYEADLDRARDGAYDEQFTIKFKDGYGGVAYETVALHVPEAPNEVPDSGGEADGDNPLTPEEPDPDDTTGGGGGGYYNANPPSGGVSVTSYPAENHINYGSRVGIITVDPVYVISPVLSDPDGDVVTIASVTTSDGGTAVIEGDQIIYTPKATDGYYFDRVTFVVDDGHGGQTTTVEDVFVANTAALPWVPDDQAVVLMISALPGEPGEVTVTRRAFDDGSAESYLAFVAMLGRYSLGEKVAGYPDLLDAYLTPPPTEPGGPDWGDPGPYIPGDGGDPDDDTNTPGVDFDGFEWIADITQFFYDESDPQLALSRASTFFGLIDHPIAADIKTAIDVARANNSLFEGDRAAVARMVVGEIASVMQQSRNPVVTVGGTVLQTALVLNAAIEDIDFDSIDETFAYMRENPEAFWEELPGAAAQVLLDTIGDVIAIGKIDIPGVKIPEVKLPDIKLPDIRWPL